MKILYITHHLIGNDGWSRYARDLIIGTQKKGAEVLCLVNEVDEKTPIPQNAILTKGPLEYLSNPLLSFFTAHKVNKIIKQFNPDIIHVIVEPYGTIIPFLKKGNVKFVLTVHSTYAFLPLLLSGIRKKIANTIARKSFRKIDSIISVSKYTEDHLIQHMQSIGTAHLLEGKLSIVSGGVAESSVDRQVRPEPRNSPKEILFVGALKPRKGLIEAVDALSHVKSDFTFRIVGFYNPESDYVKLLKQKIEEKGLVNNIIFTGRISDEELDNLYKKADLFLMLSVNNGADFEGFGLVYIEANGKGVPCVGPNDSGVVDAIVDGKTGYLVNQFDSQCVAEKIDLVLEGNTIKAQDCIDWAWQNRSEEKVKKVEEIYRGLISQ